jgi:hypothetical protein
MKKTTLRLLTVASCFLLGTIGVQAQFSFTNSNSILPNTTHSGCCIVVVDVNNDGLDDILIMDQSQTLNLELQHADGTYTNTNLGTVGGGHVWGMAAADVDHNGWKDVATGAGSCYLYKLFYSGGVVTATITPLAGSYFVQNITFGDFNNDGWVDLEVCDDNAYAKVYQNNGSGTLNASTTLINTNINPGLVYGSDPYDSGNYGSVWTDIDGDGDLDLYIAHCRQSTSSYTDERRRDRLFINDGTNHYTENAASTMMELPGNYKQTWTTSFGDMDNDGDFDCVMTNHGEASQIYQNNGSGVFTDITTGSGFTVPFDAIESAVEDFDNDGFLDILVTGPSWVMYHNNGNGTYTQTPGVMSGTGILSFGLGDLNHDGKIDIFASYGTVYNNPTTIADVLYLNTSTNTNHFITFNLTGTVSNQGAIGAKVTIYGPWGKQVREVRAGESYGTGNSFALHFGLGANTTVDSAVVQWPSHMYTNHLTNLAADQFVSLVEGGCTLTGNFMPGPGPYIVCNASSTMPLNASSGFATYAWSTGATTSSVNVSAGHYTVTVTDGLGCTSVSPAATVVLGPDQSPSVTTTGLSTGVTNPCPGTVTLTSSAASSYLWSGPGGFSATTQAIAPTVTGSYVVTIPGTCGLFSSPPQLINFVAAPAPSATGASSPIPAAVTLNAIGTGGTLNWYDALTAGTLLGTGSSYTTPLISTTTNYYVDETTSHSATAAHTAQIYHTGTNYGPTNQNAVTYFNVLGACTLQSVKVYSDSMGMRQIKLRNSAGAVLNTYNVNITADTTLIPLNWSLTPGTGYQITTDSATNTARFGGGVVAPYFWRSSTGAVYPYTNSPLVSVSGNNAGASGTNRLYYFYDWVVSGPAEVCTSSRTVVTATIGTVGISAINENTEVQVYPNPASDEATILFDNNIGNTATVVLTDVAGRMVNSWMYDKTSTGQQLKLNLSGLNAGTYFVSIKSNDKTFVQKLILTK